MYHFDYFNWVLLPLLIFVSRLCDVSLGTLRHIFISKGYKKIVPVLGFFEVLIWIIAIKQIFISSNNIACYVAWAAGFASGTYVGMFLEEKLALGLQVVRIITNQDPQQVIVALRKNNHGTTVMEGQGAMGPVKIILTIIERKNLPSVVELISEYNPNAFYSVEDTKKINSGVFANSTRATLVSKIFPSGKSK